MTPGEAGAVAEWLRNQRGVTVPLDWLEACLDWLHQEHEGGALGRESVRDMVYEQWLLSDLREIGSSCLPPGTSLQPKCELDGAYCLQVDSVVDVGSPYYSQLQKVTGTENKNVHVSATQPTQAPWEPKPSHMLMLTLTDGTQTIKGMEYRPIPCLNTGLPPGTKVCVSGHVLCRQGVMFLTRDNVQVLGGEVESLVEQNTQTALLQNALQQNTEQGQNPPRELKTQFNQENTREARKPPAPVRQQLPPARAQGTAARPQVPPFRPETPASMPPPQAVRPRVQAQASVNSSWPPAQPARPSAQFPEADDFDDQFMDEMEAAAEMEAMDDEWEDDVDYEAVMEQLDKSEPSPPPSCKHQKPSTQQPGPTMPGGSGLNPSTSTTSHRPQNFSAHSPLTSRANHRPQNPRLPESRMETNQSTIQPPPRISINITINPEQPSSVKVRPVSSSATAGHGRANVPQAASVGVEEVVNRYFTGRLHPKGQSVQERLVGSPFTYLSSLQQTPRDPRTVRVKAYISTLTSRLEHNSGREWSLKARINDGSASVEVCMGNQLLSSIIGFSAPECMEMKNRAKEQGDKAMARKIAQGFRQCQQRMISLSCIFELKVAPGQTHPYVLGLHELSPDHLSSLTRHIHTSLA